MKHLIIFLGYSQSRLDHPVYRQFTQSALYPKEVILQFLPSRLDERDLLHQIHALQKGKGQSVSDITFHLCANLHGAGDGENLLQAVRIIRRQACLQPDGEHHYPLFVYGLMPQADRCKPQVKQNVWRNLAQLNQASVRYHDCPWVQCIYLYHDETQRSLSDFLYYTISSGLTLADLLPGEDAATDYPAEPESGLFQSEASPVVCAPVFGSFNSFGVSYPEDRVRQYLRWVHLREVLKCADIAHNEVSTSDCVRLAEELARFVPTDLMNIALNDAEVHLVGSGDSSADLRQQIEQVIELQRDNLKDLRRTEWAEYLAKNLANLYETRLLPGGVEYYFSSREQRCSEYSSAIGEQLAQEFDRTVCDHRLPTDAMRPVVRALVNRLQQRALDLEHQIAEQQRAATAAEHYLAQLCEAWESSTLLSRLTGKDQKVWERYRTALADLYHAKTLVCGCRFALALLNEVIVNTAALDDRCVRVRQVLTEAAAQVAVATEEASPAPQFGIFDSHPLDAAVEWMRQDQEAHLQDYGKCLPLLFGSHPITESAEFLIHIRQALEASTDHYLDEQVSSGRFPALLNTPIVERLRTLYAAEGGFDGFVRTAKERAAIPLKLRSEPATNGNDRYLLLSSEEPRESVDKTLLTADTSRVELLHLLSGISLQQLDGFAGYRIAFEPAMF
jgi:uncharacterized coiled-coil protein SlyX